jgi:hypothetical protein
VGGSEGRIGPPLCLSLPRWHVAILAGFAVVAALLIDLIATPLLHGLPGDAFLLAWPVMALTILVVALVAAVLRRLLGPLGTSRP